jgi:hypothetical protein
LPSASTLQVLAIRLGAARFVKLVSKGRPDAVFPKVITHQLTTWLVSDDPDEVRVALTVAIVLCFERTPLVNTLISHVESASHRCRQVAVVCLYSTISDQRLLPKEDANPFRTLDATLKLYLVGDATCSTMPLTVAHWTIQCSVVLFTVAHWTMQCS